jgi:hypothetical protein
MMVMIREDLAALGVAHDTFFSEKSLYGTGAIEAALAALEERGLVYVGVLEPPKGKAPEDWEPREQTLFRSTAFGDDVDRPVKKSDGGWTYFAPDIAYHWDKVERGYDELIDVLGADHGGYVKRLKAVVAALSDGRVPLDVKLCQLVRLMKGGQEFKMSKRAGTFVTLRDVVAEVGRDVTRFVMLTRKNDAPLDFDFDRVMEQSKDNPVFYVQYAHARAQSVLARGGVGVRDRRRGARGGRSRAARRCAGGGGGAEDRRVAAPGGAGGAGARAAPDRVLSQRSGEPVSCAAASGQARSRPALRARGRAGGDQGAARAGACVPGCHRGGIGYPRRDPGQRNAITHLNLFRGWSRGAHRIWCVKTGKTP